MVIGIFAGIAFVAPIRAKARLFCLNIDNLTLTICPSFPKKYPTFFNQKVLNMPKSTMQGFLGVLFCILGGGGFQVLFCFATNYLGSLSCTNKSEYTISL